MKALRRQGSKIGFVPRKEMNFDGLIPPADDKAENNVK